MSTTRLPQSAPGNHPQRGTPFLLYRRVSSAQQASEDRVSLSEQQADCEDYLQRIGGYVAQVFDDVGISGTSRNRPGLKRLLATLKQGPVKHAVAWDEDRWARGARAYAFIQDYVEGYREIELHSRTGKLDMFVFGIKALVGKQELEDKRKRSLMGARGNAKKGKVLRVPYGYRTEHSKPVVVEAEAENVRLAYRLYRTQSTDQIARELNDRGALTQLGNPWTRHSVSYLLQNPAYKGEGRMFREHVAVRDNGEGRDIIVMEPQPQDAWMVIPFPPLVDSQTWEHTQELLKARTRSRTGTVQPFPLKRIIYCSTHQHYLTTTWRRNEQGRIYRYYVCRRDSTENPCAKSRISADYAESEARGFVFEHLLDEEKWEELRAHYMAALREGGGLEVIAKAEQRLAELEKERGRYIHQHGKGYISDAELDLFLSSILERREHYVQDLEVARRKYGGLQDQLDALEALGTPVQLRRAFIAVMRENGKDGMVKVVLRRLNVTESGELEPVINTSGVAELVDSRR